MDIKNNNGLIDKNDKDKYFLRNKSIFTELINTEGWVELVKAIQARIDDKTNILLKSASSETDIRKINELGRDIEMYKYVISEPKILIENANRYFEQEDKKQGVK